MKERRSPSLTSLTKLKIEMAFEQLKKKYAKLIQETQNIAYPIIERIQDHNEEVMDKKYGSTSEGIYKTCGTIREVKKISAVAKKKGREKVISMEDEIKRLPTAYPEATGAMGHAKSQKGFSMGERKRTELPMIGTPPWVRELKGIVKNFGKAKRRRGRDYYDIESLVRNIPEKQPEKKLKRQDYLFTILDTSGSMLGSSETGRTYLAEMSKYIIPIAKEFDGKLFMPSDYMKELVVNVNYFENKDLRKGFAKAKEITELNIVGGGGLVAEPAYEEIAIEIRDNNNARPLVITLTDGLENFPANIIKELQTSIFVMPEKNVNSFRNWNKEIAELVDDPAFPLINIVPLKFNKR